jgi:hypothetical protein
VIPSSLPIILATVALTAFAVAALAWAWSRGFLDNLEAQSRVIFEPDDFRTARPWETTGQRIEREAAYGLPIAAEPGEWGGAS